MLVALKRIPCRLHPLSSFMVSLDSRKRHRKFTYPSHYDEYHPNFRTPSRPKYKFTDPLYYDYKHEEMNGGIERIIEVVKFKKDYSIPLKGMAYVLYNAAKKGIKDKELFENYEKQMPFAPDMTLYAREAFGGLYAYYKTSLGDPTKMRYFEKAIEAHHKKVRVVEIIDLCEAFSENTNLPKSYFIEKLNKFWKKVLLLRWDKEVKFMRFNQFRLCQAFEKVGYWDKELWDRLINIIHTKKKLESGHFSLRYYEMFQRMNSDKSNPYYGKLEEQVSRLKNLLIDKKKDWNYDIEEMRELTYQEWLDYYSNLTYPQCKEIYSRMHQHEPVTDEEGEGDGEIKEKEVSREAEVVMQNKKVLSLSEDEEDK